LRAWGQTTPIFGCQQHRFYGSGSLANIHSSLIQRQRDLRRLCGNLPTPRARYSHGDRTGRYMSKHCHWQYSLDRSVRSCPVDVFVDLFTTPDTWAHGERSNYAMVLLHWTCSLGKISPQSPQKPRELLKRNLCWNSAKEGRDAMFYLSGVKLLLWFVRATAFKTPVARETQIRMCDVVHSITYLCRISFLPDRYLWHQICLQTKHRPFLKGCAFTNNKLNSSSAGVATDDSRNNRIVD